MWGPHPNPPPEKVFEIVGHHPPGRLPLVAERGQHPEQLVVEPIGHAG